MPSHWRCGFCKQSGQIESDKTHGPQLLLAIRKNHQQTSPECSILDPLYVPTGPLPEHKLILYLNNHLERQVQMLEAAAEIDTLEPVFLAVVKNELVWLDCQLGSDGESVEIGRRIEGLKERVSIAQAKAVKTT